MSAHDGGPGARGFRDGDGPGGCADYTASYVYDAVAGRPEVLGPLQFPGRAPLRRGDCAAAQGGGESACTVQACMLNARIARRGGEVDDEERALLEALRAADDEELRAAVQLALSKFYEHRRKDITRALEHAAGTGLAEGEEAAERRAVRLARRLASQS